MLTSARGLTEADLAAIADLEQRVLAVDGGRLKLEWGTLRSRSGKQVEDLLWWDGSRLIGFLGLYQFGGGDLELAGMVDPEARRSGVGTALLDAAIQLGAGRGLAKALLVTPRSTPAGRAFALSKGGALEHSEHHLVLRGTPAAGSPAHDVIVRPAVGSDAEAVHKVLSSAFGWEASGEMPLDDPAERQLVIEQGGAVIGALRLGTDQSGTGIYGFAVEPALQGKGIGRQVLAGVCRQLRDEGAEHVTLEVAVDNDRALGLYTSVGFAQEATEDYYELKLRS